MMMCQLRDHNLPETLTFMRVFHLQELVIRSIVIGRLIVQAGLDRNLEFFINGQTGGNELIKRYV